MQINGRRIGTNERPYIIAEMSANHNGSLDRALAIITAAHEAGADAVKIQLYDPELLAIKRGGKDKVLETGPWAGRTLLDIYTQGRTPIGWLGPMIKWAEELGLALFPSVFDVATLQYIDIEYDPPAYKISSFDATNLPLIRAAASTDKPLIVSTGMTSQKDVSSAFQTAYSIRGNGPALLHCVSDYPCPVEKANLGRIDELRYRFQVPVGFSDHTLGTTAAIAAVARGACIIEKHLTLDRADGGLDASFSSEPYELRELVKACHDAWAACQDSEPDNAYKDLRVTA